MKEIKTQAEPEQREEIDNLRMVATIAVIVIHASAPAVATQFDPLNTTNYTWWVANVYNSLCRFCVPMFVMISGALLLGKEEPLKSFLTKRLSRILLPFIFWALIYTLFNLALLYREGGFSGARHFFLWIAAQIIDGPAVHLWYVYMITGIYLFIPIIRPWIKIADFKFILYYIGIWMITLALHQGSILNIRAPYLTYFSGYAGYLLLGYLISEKTRPSKYLNTAAMLLFLSGFLVTLGGTYLLTQAEGAFSGYFYDYLTVNVAMMATGAFIIVRRIKILPLFLPVRTFISRFGFGIYLSHLLVLNILSHFKFDYALVNPLAGIPLTVIMCLIISGILTYTINKAPYGKYVSG